MATRQIKSGEQITEARQLSSDVSRMNDSDAATIGGILKAAEPAGEGYVMQRGFQQKRQEAAKAIPGGAAEGSVRLPDES